MKLITEMYDDFQVLEEGAGGKKEMKIQGVFMQAETKNRNGRIYPAEVLQKEVKRYNILIVLIRKILRQYLTLLFVT